MHTGLCALQFAVGAHRVRVHSVSWIRHLGMACGEMFVVRCSHNLPATAELPFANRPGDRRDRFRSTCRSSLLVDLTMYCFLVLCCFRRGSFILAKVRIVNYKCTLMCLSSQATLILCVCTFFYLVLIC